MNLKKLSISTKLRKSPGPDGILPEVLVYGGPTQVLPPDLINPILTIPFKKGDRSECGNYRGISLLSAIRKVLADILLQRLQFVLTDVYTLKINTDTGRAVVR